MCASTSTLDSSAALKLSLVTTFASDSLKCLAFTKGVPHACCVPPNGGESSDGNWNAGAPETTNSARRSHR